MAMNPLYYVYVSDRGSASARRSLPSSPKPSPISVTAPCFRLRVCPSRAGTGSTWSSRPHEFFSFHGGHSERELLDAARVSVTVGVERPGTARFDTGPSYASVGPMALDISQDGVDALVRRGIDATHLQLGYHPSWDRWGGDPNRPRPTDLLFFGNMTAHRDRLLSEAAPLLWDCNAEIRLWEGSEPTGSGPNSRPGATSAGSTADLDTLASSRVLFNLHSGEGRSLEWPVVLAAIANGCLVVTESSTDYGPLLPGEHLIAAPSDVLGAYAASLVADVALRSDLAAAAYDFVRTKLEFKTLLEPVCSLLEEAAASTTRFRRPQPISASTAPPVPPRPPQLDSILDMERHLYARINELHNGETDLLQRVEGLQAHLLYGNAGHVETFVTQAWAHATPEVSVVLTSYNDHPSVTEAMSSVTSSLGTAVELIVVDDHSEDGSVDAVRQLMASTDWFPMKLAARAANAGVGSARNAGIAEARADRVFISDAETLIFPTTLQKLSAALDKSPDSAAAYGIIAGNGRPGLLNYLPFEAARLTERDYLAAVAMIRRQVWEDIGGYDTQVRHRGYEDYEFWLGLAGNGYGVEFLPQFVGHRRAGSAPRRQVDVETAPLMSELRELYPLLPWGQS